MKKAVLSDRLYISGEDELYSEIKKKLTYSIPQNKPNAPNIEICDVYRIRDIISVPIGRTDLIPVGYEVVDRRILVPVELPKLNVILRESQQLIYNSVADNCIINAKVGFGKTITALSLIDKFQTKTLVLVHTTFLLDQWVSEIKKLFGIDAAIFGKGIHNTNSPIVVGMVQTVVKHVEKLRNEFGLIIVDEAHHVVSNTFTHIVNKLKARYKIGLSGTMIRKDGKGVLIPDYFSFNIIQPRQENVMIPYIHSIFLDEELPVAKDWVSRISALIENEAYIDVISNICSIYASKGHKVLFVSDRVSLLKELYELLPNSVLITGATKDRDEQLKLITEGDSFNIILGSVGIFKEGISINMLSCLILGIQTNNIPMLEQLIGRICRMYPDKQTPVVVDIVLQGYTAQSQYKARRSHYFNSGYNIENF